MGYHTDFYGSFQVTPSLSEKHRQYLQKFSQTRRMKRNPKKLDPNANADVGLPLGPEGAYYVDGKGFSGQDSSPDVLDHNRPPVGQPGLWCQWIPTEDGGSIEWDGNEKFYDYVEWIEYLIEHFLKPWGYVLNGSVKWEGPERGDLGVIDIENNVVAVKHGKVVYE